MKKNNYNDLEKNAKSTILAAPTGIKLDMLALRNYCRNTGTAYEKLTEKDFARFTIKKQ